MRQRHVVPSDRAPMERFLLLWDELDDLVGTSRYYVKNTAMAIWTSRPPALIALILEARPGLEFVISAPAVCRRHDNPPIRK